MNDLDLIGDVDDLRAVLRRRADRAPDPAALIPATRRLARRRRLRRRGTLIGGVVIVTVAVLIGTMLLRQANQPILPAGGPLVPPVFPFSVGPLPDGFQPAGWQSSGNDLTLRPFTDDSATYTGPDAQLAVSLFDSDPTLAPNPSGVSFPHSTTTVHGVTATIVAEQPNGQSWRLSWPVSPVAWLVIDMTARPGHSIEQSELLTIADVVTPNPSFPPTTLDIAHLPTGFMAFSWLHGVPPDGSAVTQDDVELCPKTMPKEAGENGCFHVIAGTGSRSTRRMVVGNDVQHLRWLGPDSWVGVYPGSPAGISPAEINGLLGAVSLG